LSEPFRLPLSEPFRLPLSEPLRLPLSEPFKLAARWLEPRLSGGAQAGSSRRTRTERTRVAMLVLGLGASGRPAASVIISGSELRRPPTWRNGGLRDGKKSCAAYKPYCLSLRWKVRRGIPIRAAARV